MHTQTCPPMCADTKQLPERFISTINVELYVCGSNCVIIHNLVNMVNTAKMFTCGTSLMLRSQSELFLSHILHMLNLLWLFDAVYIVCCLSMVVFVTSTMACPFCWSQNFKRVKAILLPDLRIISKFEPYV